MVYKGISGMFISVALSFLTPMEKTVNSSYDTVIFLIISLILILAFYVFISQIWLPFVRDLRDIKREIDRNVGEKRDHYKRELKLFYISKIPIIGKIIYEKKRGG